MDEREPEHSNSVLLSPPDNMQMSEVIAYLRSIESDIHAIRVEIDAAKDAVRKSRNPIIKGLFPWL